MNDQKIIKVITENVCPHCQKPIVISTKVATPWIDWILREEDIKKAKESVRNKIEKIKFNSEEEKINILEWLDNPDTMFGFEEIDATLYQLLNIAKKEDKKKKNEEIKETSKEVEREKGNNIK